MNNKTTTVKALGYKAPAIKVHTVVTSCGILESDWRPEFDIDTNLEGLGGFFGGGDASTAD